MRKHIISNKGFTLVELLAVILIVGIIASIAAYSITGISKSVKAGHRKNVISRIEVAAEKYAYDKNETQVFVIDLVKSGYLQSDDDNDNVFDPVDNSKLNCYAVKMNSQGNYYKATLEDSKEYELSDGSCNYTRLEEMNSSLMMSAAQEINGQIVNINSKNWIKGDFAIFVYFNNDTKINCSNSVSTVQSPKCSISSTLGELTNSIFTTVDGQARIDILGSELGFEREGTYTFTYNRITNDNNGAKELKESITLKLDNKAPEVIVSNRDVTIIENGSGVDSYCINNTSGGVNDCNWIGITSNTIHLENNLNANTDYYIHVKDKVGNIGEGHINILSN